MGLSLGTPMARVSESALPEARCVGHPGADVEHLFLALLIDGGPVGEVLRGLGLSLDSARAAVARVHAAGLQHLGVRVTATRGSAGGPGAVAVFTEPAARVLAESREDPRRLLRALLDQPSGVVGEVLAEADLCPDAVRDSLRDPDVPTDSAPSHPAADASPAPPGWAPVHRCEAGVQAPIGDVWDLLVDDGQRLRVAARDLRPWGS